MERFTHYGREIFDGDTLVAETARMEPTRNSNASALGLAGRITAIMNMTNGMPLELIAQRLAAPSPS